MLVVAAELGVDTLERRVTVSLRLLDTIRWERRYISDLLVLCCCFSVCMQAMA